MRRRTFLVIPLAAGEFIRRFVPNGPKKLADPLKMGVGSFDARLIEKLNARFIKGRGMNTGASPEVIPGLTPQELQQTVNSPGVGMLVKPRIVLNTNPVGVGTSPVMLANAYQSRKVLRIQNTGISIIYIGFGFSPTTVNYTYSLAPGTAANDGTGGAVSDADWLGNVWAISSAAGGSLVFNEEP